MWWIPSRCRPTARSGTCRMSSSHRTCRPIPRCRRSSATRCWSRICAVMPRVSRCCRSWTSNGGTDAQRSAALGQPGDDAARNLRSRSAAHVHADVPGSDAAAGVVATADALGEHRRGRCRHDVVLERVEVEQRLADVTQAHAPTADAQRIAHQAILLIEPADELCQRRGTLRRGVEDPLLHADEVLDGALIRPAGEQAHVLLLCEAHRHEREEQSIQKLARYVAAALEERSVEPADPLREEVLGRVEVHRGGERDETGDGVRVQCRVAQAEHAALANPEQLEPLTPVARADAAHAAAEMPSMYSSRSTCRSASSGSPQSIK